MLATRAPHAVPCSLRQSSRCHPTRGGGCPAAPSASTPMGSSPSGARGSQPALSRQPPQRPGVAGFHYQSPSCMRRPRVATQAGLKDMLGALFAGSAQKEDDGKRPLRVLCLHGKYENAAAFAVRTEFLDDCEPVDGLREVSWEYINGTFEVRRNEAFEWWKLPPGERSFTATSYEGAEVSLALIEQIWEDSGPFDGIMGFSQGAMLAAVVAAKGVLDPDYKAKPKFAIIYSAAYPLPFKGLLEKLRAGGHAVPSLHVLGRQDSTNPPELGQKLAACFADAQVMWHEGAHTVPDDPYIIAATHQFCTRAVSTPPQDGEMRE